jgi:hypothetical protein
MRGDCLETEAWCAQDTPLNPSFMHLHLGLDADGLDTPELHHIVVPSWHRGVDAEQARSPRSHAARLALLCCSRVRCARNHD